MIDPGSSVTGQRGPSFLLPCKVLRGPERSRACAQHAGGAVLISTHAEGALSLPDQALVDVHIFEGARGVLEALRAHDCAPALAWCEEHRPRLRKLKSKLEFKLRVQVRAQGSPLRKGGAACTVLPMTNRSHAHGPIMYHAAFVGGRQYR